MSTPPTTIPSYESQLALRHDTEELNRKAFQVAKHIGTLRKGWWAMFRDGRLIVQAPTKVELYALCNVVYDCYVDYVAE